MPSFLSATEKDAWNVKTFDVDFKKMEESSRMVELVLEGHSLFISGQKYNFKP